ncbi:hypothetical protein ABTM42_21195, partial [Acinetobacter baumannii]
MASLRGKDVTELNYHWSVSRRLSLQGQRYSLQDDHDGTTHFIQNQTAKWDLGQGLEFRGRF